MAGAEKFVDIMREVAQHAYPHHDRRGIRGISETGGFDGTAS